MCPFLPIRRKVTFFSFGARYTFLLLSLPAILSASAHYGGTLITSIASPPKSFNPIIAKETSTTTVTGYIFEGLTRLDPHTLEIKPNLAASWRTDASGKIWTFSLRTDVKWNDGVPFTADDVLFTFNRLIFNPSIPTSSRDIFTIQGKTPRVEKINSHTVRITLPSRFAPFLMLMSQDILPAHLLKSEVSKNRFTFSLGLNSRPADIVGTGPFMLENFRPGEYLILKKNPYYWKKSSQGNSLPYLDRLILIITPDQNLALLKLKKGELDLLPLRAQDYLVLRKSPPDKIRFFNAGPSLGSDFIILNQNLDSPVASYKLAWFRNPMFRKAIAFALDRHAIIKNVYAGYGYPLDGPVSKSAVSFYNRKIKEYPYDLERAKKSLREGGFFWKNRLLYDKEGNQVSFSLLTNSNNSERIQIANFIRSDLEKIGMKINFLPVDFNSLVNRIDSTKDWEAVMIGLSGGIDPHSGKNVWMTTGQLHMWNPGSPRSYYPWEYEIDRIFDTAAQELNPAKRKELYDRWQEIVQKELPMIFTVTPAVLYAYHTKLGNIEPTVYGGLLHNVEELYLKK